MKISFSTKNISKNVIYILCEEELEQKNWAVIKEESHCTLVSRMLADKALSCSFASSYTSYINDKTPERIAVIVAGKLADLTENKVIKLGGAMFSLLKTHKIKDSDIVVTTKIEEIGIANLALGVALKNYSFNQYKSFEKIEDNFVPDNLYFITTDEKRANEDFTELSAEIDGVNLARDLISEPPNVLFPKSYAEKCMALEKLDIGLKVEVLDVQDMKNLGMNALLGVGQGSSKDSQMVVIRYNGARASDQPVAFVGKGVTFDTGGISLKPGVGMEDMKYDMAGSAAVVGSMLALAKRKAKVNAVGVIGLVENMPDGNAQRPADVVKSMSGQTIEILNTDAEGRLVLADALWYTQERFKPKFMVNLATLTGAIVIALGATYAGLFSNDDTLAEELYKVGLETDEKLWRFPLHAEYDKDIDSDIADVRNLARTERNAGSIAAAQFLQRFVNNVPWAHLDIAGVAWSKKDCHTCPKGAVGFGVRLLNKLVKRYYEV